MVLEINLVAAYTKSAKMQCPLLDHGDGDGDGDGDVRMRERLEAERGARGRVRVCQTK